MTDKGAKSRQGTAYVVWVGGRTGTVQLPLWWSSADAVFGRNALPPIST